MCTVPSHPPPWQEIDHKLLTRHMHALFMREHCSCLFAVKSFPLKEADGTTAIRRMRQGQNAAALESVLYRSYDPSLVKDLEVWDATACVRSVSSG